MNYVGNAVSCALLASHFLPLHPQTGDDRKGGLIKSHNTYSNCIASHLSSSSLYFYPKVVLIFSGATLIVTSLRSMS